MEVANRFKGLDLIDRVPEELWMEVHDIVQEAGIKTVPKEKKCKKAKWLSEEALQIAVNRRETKSKREKEMQKSKMAVWGGFTNIWGKKSSEKQRRKGKLYPFECRVPKNSQER